MDIKLYMLIGLFSVPVMLGIVVITEHLSKTPRANKFRKWWSNNVVDLDDRYDD
jgi:hypothetical protein